MTMRDLEYQGRALARLDKYLDHLSKEKLNADKVASLVKSNPGIKLDVPEFTRNAWESLRSSGELPETRNGLPHSPRQDGVGRYVPNVVFKVPTGGGKTFLAVAALSKIFGKYLGTSKGFVLWIVPNEAIYSQTKRQLYDRQHPYRQMLDVLSGNKVMIMEKESRLDAMDVEGNLCVMLLMLQSSNRENKDSLRMFRDRGDVRGFFPPEGDQQAHEAALLQTPNLDAYDLADSGYPWRQVKDSLGNALRLIRPVVVLDEGHKAISNLAFNTLFGFNPCFVLELTATPKDVAATTGRNPQPARYSNVLVEVRGIDLDREGMIKMPLNLDPRTGPNWKDSLAAAVSRLKTLDGHASSLLSNTGRHIRPILLVQVERTGSDKRDRTHVHALDVKDWLMNTGGFAEEEIAVKTADTNDLATPENQDLMAFANRVRVIITKQALQEGWDCPFAYILCSLAASSNLSAMTQLVGRILRQPYAEKTGVQALDESYVITHHAATGDVVSAIKKGLEEDGLGDLVTEIKTGVQTSGSGKRKVKRRTNFDQEDIYLPQILRVSDESIRAIDYEEDVLFALEWSDLDVSPLVARIPDNVTVAEQQMRRIRLADSGGKIIDEVAGSSPEVLAFDLPYAARMISDIVPNAWVAHEIVSGLVSGLMARGFDHAKLGRLSGLIIDEMRKWLGDMRDVKAEAHFRKEVKSGRIQFRLRADGRNWKMPMEIETMEPLGAEQLVGHDGGALTKSLFSPIYKGDFSNPDERSVAVHLDGDKALYWWHRNVARQHYSVQGWRRDRIYPDFVFAIKRENGKLRIVVLEMKGDQLAGNNDTNYKRSVLNLLSEAYDTDQTVPVGQLQLAIANANVQCDMVLFSEHQTKLPKLLSP